MSRVHWKRSPGKREMGRVRGFEVSCSYMPVGTVAGFLGSEISSVDWRQKAPEKGKQ